MIEQAAWRLRGYDIELCNCDPGCGCNFKGAPSSPEGNCEAFLGFSIEEGNYGDVSLSGARMAWALWWPGAIHQGGGRGHAYIDCPGDDQYEALRAIVRGEAGYDFFVIFNGSFTEPTAVDRAPIAMKVDGKNSRFSVAGVGEVVMTPLRSPVGGEENDVRIVKDSGFIWKDGHVVQGERLRVQLPEMSFDHAGRHGVFARFDWSNG